MKNIILIGFMGSGKTTVGKILAKNLNFNFIDTDELIEKNESMTIPKIFEIYGENYFRKCENKILNNLKNVNKCVISTGGGFPVYLKKINILKSLGIIFYLHANCETLLKRVKSSNRPLLKNFFNLYRTRLPYYKKISDFKIDTDYINPDKISLIIQEIYENCGR